MGKTWNSMILLAGCLTSTSVMISYLLWLKYNQIKEKLEEKEREIEKEKELRQVERQGRITSQKEKRKEIQKTQAISGFNFSPIGVIESPFPDRRGTPRQPNLVRAATARIKFDRTKIQYEHFKELEEFSHIWVIWVFHENTNLDSNRIAAKIKPPRLHGSRVGCLSTRSPHRPNPIGLSVSEIISVGPDYIDIHCVDMISGTPVLDGLS
jgi:tRNA-Thr(GGU) m(6)t(6)A37 methyltransferase TsaA